MTEQHKRKILITHLGGTIGMIRDPETGRLRPPKDAAEFQQAINKIIEIFQREHPDCEVEFACLSTVDSNDINPELLEEYIAYIKAREHEFDAIVATHGTDTEASTLAATTLAFTNIDKLGSQPLSSLPIVITGSQASTFDEPQDATRNLLNSLLAAEILCRDRYYQCVVQVFGSRIIDAAYSAKIDESGDDAFDAVDKRGLIGECSSAKGAKFDESFLRRCYTLGFLQRGENLMYGSATGHTLPSSRFMISPLKQVRADDELLGVPVKEGHYVHPVPASTFGHPSSISLQANDPNCLGVALSLTGAGNAPFFYCESIHDAVMARGVPFYGSLDIKGGAASLDSYEAGARIGKAGVVIGHDASAAHSFISMQWALANMDPKLDPRNYLKVIRAAHHLNWDNSDRPPEGQKLHPLPEVFNHAANGEGSFTHSHEQMTSRMNAYRVWKAAQRKLRWITVEDPGIVARVVAHLPPARRSLILPAHAELQFDNLQAT